MAQETNDKFNEIYHLLYKLIYTYCYERVDKNREAAEDVAQNVFLTLWLNFDSLSASPTVNYKLWLLKTAKLKLYEYYRDRKKRMRDSYELESPEYAETLLSEHDMTEEIIKLKVDANLDLYTDLILSKLNNQDLTLYK